jgi:hypothetical protein
MFAALDRRRTAEREANSGRAGPNPQHRRAAIRKEHQLQDYLRTQAAERRQGVS